MDLLSLSLTLRPLPAPDPTAPLPEWWGRAAHALLLNVARAADPALAESLHADNAIRPFTVSNLRGPTPHGALDPQASYSLRLSAFSQPLAEILERAAAEGPLSPGQQIELDYLPFAIEAANGGQGDLQQDSYAGLSAPYLLAKTSPAAPGAPAAGKPHHLQIWRKARAGPAAGAGLWQPAGALECLRPGQLSARAEALRGRMPGHRALPPEHARHPAQRRRFAHWRGRRSGLHHPEL